MRQLEINHVGPVYGSVAIPGSKNSAVALLAACCLADEPVTLFGIPNIFDVRVICKLLRELGATVNRETPGSITIDPRNIHHATLDPDKSSTYRASYYFVGSLLQKYKKVSIGYPGGDDFNSRPIDQHFKGLSILGAKVRTDKHSYTVSANQLIGHDIYFDTITSGATMNLILAAVLAKGKTTLYNAAKDPEIVDLTNLLNKMGAKIKGAGSDQITITGVKQLGGCSHRVIPDRLVAGSLLMAPGLTGGRVTVDGVIPNHLQSCLSKFSEIGLDVHVQDDQITVQKDGKLKATRVRTGMYPLFATDLQQPITSLLLGAEGKSIITEKVFPHRFQHVSQLIRMGATIKMKNSTAILQGGTPLIGSHVHATDVRAGTSLILASLIAEGTTTISGVHHIERGNEDIIGLFKQIGVNMRMRSGSMIYEDKKNPLHDQQFRVE